MTLPAQDDHNNLLVPSFYKKHETLEAMKIVIGKIPKVPQAGG